MEKFGRLYEIFFFYNYYEMNDRDSFNVTVTGLTIVKGMTGDILQHTAHICLHNTAQFYHFKSYYIV